MKQVKYDQKKFMEILYRTDAYQREAMLYAKGQYYYQAPVIGRLSAEKVWDSLLTVRNSNPDRGITAKTVLPGTALFKEIADLNDKEKMNYVEKHFSNGKSFRQQKVKGAKKIKVDNGRASLLKSPAGTGSLPGRNPQRSCRRPWR